MLTTTIQHFSFSNCLMNAAGVHCYHRKDLEELLHSSAGSFVTKTATLHERTGNPEPRYQNTLLGSINSMGLPNLGIDYYLNYLLSIEKINNTPLFLSVTGLSINEIHQILYKIESSDFKGLVELNLSCPNVIGKPQIAYDFETTNQLLKEIFSYFTKPLGVKLPPYFDMVHFDSIANILNQYPIYFVNSINSIGNGLIIEDEQVIIKPKNGFGGIGGEYIKPAALANVHALYQRLNKEIAIIGTGGITSGRDIFEHILCGASIVQIGTQLQKEGVAVFDRLTKELQKIMITKGYHTINDFKGKLQYQ